MRFARTYVLAFFSLVLAFPAFAQIPQSDSTTATPIPAAGHDYLGGFNETVNPANGSLSIRVNAAMPPGRGITLPFSFAYDSSGAAHLQLSANSNSATGQWRWISTPISVGGWSISVPVVSYTLQTWTTQPEGAPKPTTCYATINFAFQDARGSRHNLDLTNYSFVNSPSGACATDTWDWPQYFTGAVVTQGGEGPILATIPTNWSTTPTVTVTDGDGTVFTFPFYTGNIGNGSNTANPASSAVDRNGNTVTLNTSTSLSYVDTTGRTVLQDSGFTASPETVNVSGLGAPYTVNWTALSTPTFSTPITVLYGTCYTGIESWNGVKGVSSVTLPNGQSYSFLYDSTYGLIKKITYPSAGYVRYVWGINTQAEVASDTPCTMLYGVPVITDRYVSFDGTTEVLHQNFSYNTCWTSTCSGTSQAWMSKTTTVTTYDLVRNTNFQTIYTYGTGPADDPPNSGPPNQSVPVESSIAYHDTSGSLLKTVSKTWQNARLLTSQTTTFPNNQVSKTVWTYNSNEMQTEQDDYDFGSGGPGAFLRATVTNYATFSNHIVDKPSSVIVYSDSGKTNRVAETDYTYDSPAGTVTSGIVQHSAGCNCGNVTAEARWLNTSGSTLTTSYTNDDTGQRLSMTDPRGNMTSYSYADNYSSGTPPGPTNAYLTQVTHPQTNSVNHVEHFAYAYASGEVATSTDQNNLVTNYKYNDNLARLTETDFPDGGVTTISHNDSPYSPSTPSPSVTTTKKINSSTNVVTVSASDGIGHPVTSLITSDPQGTIHTDTRYDGMGRVYTVSNPYRSGSDPTTSSGTTTYAYDAIGRKLTETYPDNSVLTTAYCAGSTLVTDPTGKWRRSRVDGLGRLVEVDEPNAPGATVASSGCPGTGEPIWVTNYSLNALGNLTQVVQNGSHTRTFTYDSLSRLLCASNPETSYAACPSSATSTYTAGTTGYAYDPDGNVATKTVSSSQSAGTSGSGSGTVNGSEQSIAGAPAVSGTGSVTFSGTLQSKQVQTQAAKSGSGSVTISGSEQSTQVCKKWSADGSTCLIWGTVYDHGTVSITVNGAISSVSYGQLDTTSSIATNLASAINANTNINSLVSASASGAIVTITAKQTGSQTNYSLSATAATGDPTDFSSTSFSTSQSGSTLTGGADAVYTTVYDSGTSTIAVNGHADTVSWSGSGTTTSSIASALASTINADSGAYVTASASGATVNLTAKSAGASTDYSLSSSYTYDTTDFSSSSFTSSTSGSTLTGGRDAGATIYDSGSVWITINGTQYSVSYGQGSTTSSLASSIASAISAGSLANASANGSGITITAKTVGTATNYSLSSGSSTGNPSQFSSPSFSVSVSGSSLTGGTDPGLPIVTSYSYDALNRETSTTYSNGDPTIATTYDQSNCLGLSACQNIGQRTSMTDAAGSEAWSYQVDSANLRSIHVNQRTTSGITKTSTYYFDLAGNVTQAVYPTGRVVNYTYDAADRPKTAADGSNGITYATDFQSAPAGCLSGAVCYTPQGTFYALSIGQSSGFTGLNLTHIYNSRLQPNEFKASSSGGNAIDITYNFVDSASGKNAGHVNGITNNLDGTRSQAFSYDQLNRLTSAWTTSTYSTSPAHCWGESFTLDAWSNLNIIAATSNSAYTGCYLESGFSAIADANNHVPMWSYDAAGNATADGFTAYVWNAESELKSAAGVNYLYDGDGRRASKSNGKLYWYGSGRDILAETNASGSTTAEYIFFGGKRIAVIPAGGNAVYYVEDMLGTSRVTTTNTGAVCYDADFYPYGGERAYTNTCPQNYKFEGKERDTETGNDDFGARYYSNRFGRWLSADWSSVPVPVPYANLTNPQTLNLYSMVADDPESFADLDGHDPQQGSAAQEIKCRPNVAGCTQNEREQLRVAKDAKLADDQKPQPAQQKQDKPDTGLTRAQMQQVLDLTTMLFTMGVLEAANMGSADAESTATSQDTTAAETAATETAAARATSLANTMGKTKDFATIAVTETAEGTRIVSSSEARGLRPATLAALGEGEVAVRGSGHAEVNGLKAAKQMGLTPTGVAASRPICAGCWEAMKAAGAAALSALKNIVL